MKIIYSCGCGAQFSVEYDSDFCAHAAGRHDEFLKNHIICRSQKTTKSVDTSPNKLKAEIALRINHLLSSFDKCNISKDDFIEQVNVCVAQLSAV